MTNKIQVVDAICGAGKTTWVFDHMRQHPERKWLFVSPYLAEVGDEETKGRIQKELPKLNFKSPGSGSKTEDFKRLAKKGFNIAISHKLFTGFNAEVAALLKENEYHIIVDEVIDMVGFYEDISHEDVQFLVLAGMVIVGEKGQLFWNNDKWPNYKGRDIKVKELCELGCLWIYGENVLIQRIPPACIKACQTVTILTYLFESSLMHCWMQLYEIDWSYLEPKELRSNKEIKQLIRDKLKLIEPSRAIKDMQRTAYGAPLDSTFNVSWYQGAKDEELTKVRKSVEVTLKEQMGPGPTFWTTFKDYEKKLAGVGYKRARKAPEGGLRKPFVSKNMRASNEYRDCTNCIYTINIYPHGSLDNHLKMFGINLDRELYALSEIVQFIFRGSIREHKQMDLYILSDRMRRIVKQWLDEEY